MPATIEPITWEEVEQVVMHEAELVLGFFGPPGIGKTSKFFRWADEYEVPYIGHIPSHDEMAPSEMMGVLVPGDKGKSWVPGPADLAYKQGGWLLIDEINELSGPCKTHAYSLLDKGPGGTISYLGREFEQAEGYRVFATMNEDPNDGSLSPALLDRFHAWFLLSEPTPELYAMLDPKLRKHCRRLYRRAPNKLAGPDFTFRNFLSLQSMMEVLPLDKALLAVCRGNQRLAYSVYEGLTIGHKEDDVAEDSDDGDEEEEEA